MAASTARTCLRSDGDCVHSQKRDHASGRESSNDMVGTLAQLPGRTDVRPAPSLPPLMEKLVIEGGVPLSGTVVPAGNKNAELAERIRASFLVAGPLLARFGEAHMPPPGGDVIGRRRLDPHLDAFKALGAEVSLNGRYYIDAPVGLRACDFFMDEPSVMATENALMAAALTPG